MSPTVTFSISPLIHISSKFQCNLLLPPPLAVITMASFSGRTNTSVLNGCSYSIWNSKHVLRPYNTISLWHHLWFFSSLSLACFISISFVGFCFLSILYAGVPQKSIFSHLLLLHSTLPSSVVSLPVVSVTCGQLWLKSSFWGMVRRSIVA